MPPAALYATIAAIAVAAQSNKFHLTSCRFFLFNPACCESNVREVMQASSILVEWQLTGRLRINPRRHTTAVPRLLKCSKQALKPCTRAATTFKARSFPAIICPLRNSVHLKACSGDRKFTKAYARPCRVPVLLEATSTRFLLGGSHNKKSYCPAKPKLSSHCRVSS